MDTRTAIEIRTSDLTLSPERMLPIKSLVQTRVPRSARVSTIVLHLNRLEGETTEAFKAIVVAHCEDGSQIQSESSGDTLYRSVTLAMGLLRNKLRERVFMPAQARAVG